MAASAEPALVCCPACACCPDFLHDYIFLTVGRVGSSTDLIAQHVEYVQQDQKRETVLDCVKMVDVSVMPGALRLMPSACKGSVCGRNLDGNLEGSSTP